MSQYLDKLSPVQREAAANFNGPSLIVAGAGSGKTRVLTYRIAHMLEEGISPYSILALTFTNKAAKEMRDRIEAVISPEKARGLWMGTFHSVFAKILRREAELLGYPSSFTIYDTNDAKNLVKTIVRDMNLNEETYKPGDVYSRISLAKNNLILPDAYESNAVLTGEDRERRRPQFVNIYREYIRRCKACGAMDFDDLLLNMNILFRDFPQALERYREKFRYVLVDEYQDTNAAQYLIVKRIAEGHKNVCVVGDDAQSIYSFRGAKIENILRFQKDYPGAKVYKLEQNYRSTPTIVGAANSIIDKNKNQIRKELFSKNEDGDKIRLMKAYTDKEEAAIVVGDIYSLSRVSRVPYGEMAILYRTNAQSRVFEEALRMRNIPYIVFGGQSFYQRKEIKDILAYVRLAVNGRDDEAFKRVINYPARGIGDVTLGKIASTAAKHGVGMLDVITRLTPEQMELRGAAGVKIKEFAAMIAEFAAMIHTTSAYDMGLHIATRSGIVGSFKMQNTPESMSTLDNINELLNSIASFVESPSGDVPEGEKPTIADWLQNVSLLTDMDKEGEGAERERVTLMTVHSAKGLEFEYVYIVGMEENLFPGLMSSDSAEGLEEERRLFYVALTRAKKGAVLTFSDTRFRWGDMTSNRPSRFLKDIDPSYLDVRFGTESDEDAPPARQRPSYGGYQRGSENRQQSKIEKEPAAYERKPVMRGNFKKVATGAGSHGTDAAGIKAGSVVRHDKFGQGTVLILEETPNGAKATVRFDEAGEKTLLLKYAKLTPVEE